MSNKIKLYLAASAALISLLVACGGSSSSTAADPLLPPASLDINSVASTLGIGDGGSGGDSGGDSGAAGGAGDGAPLRKAVVTLVDAAGNSVNGLTDTNGKYLLKYKSTVFKAPMVLRVIDAGGNVLTSIAETVAPSGQVTVVNVNPLTDKITSDALSSSVSGTDKTFDGSSIDLSKLVQAKANLVASIKAALNTAGIANTSNFDPIKSVYSYDGTGVDAIIESISHARDPSTGATQLMPKLGGVTTNADGTITPTLITSAAPLQSAQVVVPTSPALNFAKLYNWTSELNRCFALSTAARQADANCLDADGTRLVSSNFLNSSYDLKENYNSLFSNSDLEPIQGSTLRNPVVLYVGKYPGSTAAYDDLAVVEMTVYQPATGPLAGAVSSPIEYTTNFIFKRDDSLTRSKAGNWILHGNQRQYALNVYSRYKRYTQLNPLKDVNVVGAVPSTMQSRLNLTFRPYVFDRATRTYISANVRAVRVTGPGLPSVGVVLLPNTVVGSNNLGIDNKTGFIPATSTSTSTSSNSFGLGSVISSDGSTDNSFNTASARNVSTPITDYSSFQAYALYKFEIFLNSSSSTTIPDAIEYTRNLGSVSPPSIARGFQYNDVSPSYSFATSPAAATTSFNVQWNNNLNAGPVTSAQLTSTVGTGIDASSNVYAAYSVGARPTSQVVNAPSGSFPALSNVVGTNRSVAIWSSVNRGQIQNQAEWIN